LQSSRKTVLSETTRVVEVEVIGFTGGQVERSLLLLLLLVSTLLLLLSTDGSSIDGGRRGCAGDAAVDAAVMTDATAADGRSQEGGRKADHALDIIY